MGTRSTIRFKQDGETLVTIYQQYDGYPSCVGLKLAKFCAARKVINGYSDQTIETHANGMGCLAAQFIAKVKTDIGGVYIQKGHSEEYNYVVKESAGRILIKCPEAGVNKFQDAAALTRVWADE